MSFDFSTLITDRTYADVSRVKELSSKIRSGTASESELAEFNSAAMKGAYNYTDLNRVTAAMEALKAKLEGYGYAVPGYQKIKIPHPSAGGGSRLPEGYTELAWIESTGTQYVDTEFKPNQDTRIVADIQVTTENEILAANDLFGVRTSASSKAYAIQWNTSNNYFQHFYNNGYDNLDFGSLTDRQIVELNKNILSINGVTHERTYAAFQCDYSLYICAINNAGTATFFSKMRVHSCQIYDNGTLIRDYVPCINPDGAVGLYDLVTAAFFDNRGTGGFVAGSVVHPALPDGCSWIEYIGSSGTQYIDTGFKPNQDTRVVVDIEATTTHATKTIFGARVGYKSTDYTCWYISDTKFQTGYGNNADTFNVDTILKRLTIDKNKNVTTVGSYGVTLTENTFQSDYSMFLFGMNQAGSIDSRMITAKLYSCQIYDNGTLVRLFIPVVVASGAVGLYDLVTAAFYGNDGSGTFSAGNTVEVVSAASFADDSELDPYLWYEVDAPSAEQMTVYFLNVSVIRAVLAVMETTPAVPADMVGLMVEEANNIEAILLDVYRQLNIMATTFIPAGEALCGGDNL